MTIPIVSRVEITPPTPSKLPEERELRVYARRKKNQDQDALQDSHTDPTLEQDQLAASPENIEPENALGNPKWKSAMVEEMEALHIKLIGSVEKYKARLVAKGYTQTYGIDYHETFAPMAKINTIWVLLSLAANLDWPLQLFDVKNAFLHGEVEEGVYMDLPSSFTTASDVGKVMMKKELEGCEIILQKKFEMKDLACQSIDTPIEQNHKLGDDRVDQVPTNKERYQRLVGRLIYLSHTRPDLAYAVSVVSQFMHSPNEVHMDVVHRILRYLKSAPDADWVGSITNRKSTSGYFTFVGGNLVTWRSKKQNVVARSSAEAEYRAMSLFTQYNKAAISIAHNPVQHDRTKHVEVDRHFIKEKLTDGIISVPFVKSEDQLADILTKAISSRVLYSTLVKLGIQDIYAPN
uniref:Reverse transcriptase Ty1/copia-type domain-containing protein n=1 Tax=Fagus sylvatica TaxID=28930 RepID=A0A2N9GP18_FAGSY